MTKVFLLLNQTEEKDIIKNILLKNSLDVVEAQGTIEDILTQIHNYLPDIILCQNTRENCEYEIRRIKTVAKNQNMQIILLSDNSTDTSYVNLADGIVESPINQNRENILIASINSHIKIKKSLDRLYENNKELSRSLYQLNVLYNTSSQFAGTLNTNKLYDIMIDAMEKTLSFDISSVLIVNTPSSIPVFKLNTIHTPCDNLVDALKIRSILNYKTVFDDGKLPCENDFDNLECSLSIKQARSNKVFGLDCVSFDSLFAPIKVGDEFFGVIELFRSVPYTTEDVACFQAITHQAALPLRSAKLYEEISITNKKLEKLEKLKSEFVSIVSHELRTPLTPINNSLEIVLSEQAGSISDDAKNFIVMAKRNIQRLSGIIEDLLDLSRIQTGKLDFKYKMYDITSSLELLKNTFLQVASEKNININLQINQKLPEIYADSRRIEQIFSNLVSNALKFTPQDGNINVQAEVINSSSVNFDDLVMPKNALTGDYIKVSVQDNGIGIKKEDIPKIFDKFSQIESSLNRNKGGVGLGLTITKQLIDSHLGAIWVNSEEKIGSEFNVILPLPDEFKIFQMDLSHALINNEVGIIKIKFNKDLNLIQTLKDNKLLNLSKLSKEVSFEDDNDIIYYTFVPKVSRDSFNALYSTLCDFCQKSDKDKIAIFGVHSELDGEDVQKLLKKLNN